MVCSMLPMKVVSSQSGVDMCPAVYVLNKIIYLINRSTSNAIWDLEALIFRKRIPKIKEQSRSMWDHANVVLGSTRAGSPCYAVVVGVTNKRQNR